MTAARRLQRWIWLSLLLLGSVGWSQTASESAVKAGFAVNFAKFVEWPVAALPMGTPMQWCFQSADVQTAFMRLADGKSMQGHPIVVRRVARAEDLKGCHVVYLGDLDERRLRELLRQLRAQPVLTLGDADGFVDLGGVIGLVAEGDRFQFEVNVAAAQEAGLKVSSQLLRLARQLRGQP